MTVLDPGSPVSLPDVLVPHAQVDSAPFGDRPRRQCERVSPMTPQSMTSQGAPVARGELLACRHFTSDLPLAATAAWPVVNYPIMTTCWPRVTKAAQNIPLAEGKFSNNPEPRRLTATRYGSGGSRIT
jgi:hypothetical protein